MSSIESLPLEISDHILSFLTESLARPGRAIAFPRGRPPMFPRFFEGDTPTFCNLALVSRTLRRRVNSYTQHLHRIIEHFDPPTTSFSIATVVKPRCPVCLGAVAAGGRRHDWSGRELTVVTAEVMYPDQVYLCKRCFMTLCDMPNAINVRVVKVCYSALKSPTNVPLQVFADAALLEHAFYAHDKVRTQANLEDRKSVV